MRKQRRTCVRVCVCVRRSCVCAGVCLDERRRNNLHGRVDGSHTAGKASEFECRRGCFGRTREIGERRRENVQ